MTVLRDVVIVGALRTPIGRVGGALAGVRPDDLSAHVMLALVERTGIDPAAIGDVLWGCANQAGEDNRNVARMALLLAGFPHEVPGVTVNRLCASGLEAVHQASRAIAVGDLDLAIAGGVESMTRAPLVMDKGGQPFARGNRTAYDTALGWRFPNPAMEKRFPLEAMGETAENVAERYGIDRAAQDAFAVDSHRNALDAWGRGAFDDEVIPVPLPRARGATEAESFAKDEGPRTDSTPEKLARLKPAFRAGGTVTAGNSSSLNDGAAALLLASAEKAKALGLRPLARIIGRQAAGVDPRFMGMGPVPATRKLLERVGLRISDLDVVELNEAFAAQSLAVLRELELDPARVNVNGGAIALGHPLGCSGARVLVTLVHALRKRGGRYGLATLCVGVGQGVSCLIERLEE